MKQRLKEHKGITLVALIITIIVLLILAVVAISAVSGNGILSHASNARNKYTDSQINETATISEYEDYIEDNLPGAVKKLKNNLNKVLSTTDNIPLLDEYGNKIMLPAGFKILVDDTTSYKADTIDVTKGIVVEDTQAETAGNQFVWIPVGKIYTDVAKTEANAKTITLGRYANFTKNADGTYTVTQNASEYATPISINGLIGSFKHTEYNTTQSNAIAKNIGDFCTKANANGGYYIGRYEARTAIERTSKDDTLETVTSKANDYVYNYVTQPQAAEKCQSMYTNKPFESDLINSYAWDTAIIFFQEFGDNSTYASKKSVNSSLLNKGTVNETNKDVICNVYDMASNCYEWSTETHSDSSSPCTERGGRYSNNNLCSSSRYGIDTTGANDYRSFRPILYM